MQAKMRWNRQNRKGVAAVEFAVILPLLVVLMFGIWEVSRLIAVQEVMTNAVREGGRQCSTAQVDTATAKQAVVDYMAEYNITVALTDVTISNLTNSGRSDPKNCNQLDQWRMTLSVPIANVRWLSPGFFRYSGNLTTLADWYSMCDVPATVSYSIPPE